MQTVLAATKQLVDGYAKVTLSVYIDGHKLDVGVGAGSYTGACAGDDEFSFGNACAAGVNLTLAVSRPDLKGRRIQIKWAVDDTEYPLLTGLIAKAKVVAGRTEIEAWDDLYHAGSKVFEITDAIAGDCTAATAFSAVAAAMGVTVDNSALELLSGITIPGGLSAFRSSVTRAAVAGHIAGLVGGNALMSRDGLLTIRQYTAVDWETEPYTGGASAENEDFSVTGITLQSERVVVTLNDDGSTVERTVTEEYTAGDGSLMLANPLASQEAADAAYAALASVTIRPGNYSFPGGLLLEPGDIFTVNSMDGSYAVAVSSISMTFDGGVRSSVACGGAAEDGTGTKGAINQALQALLADYAKFKKLTADNAEINSANILQLIVGDVIANRIKAGIIKSKDGSSFEINLDTGEITAGNVHLTGDFHNSETLGDYRDDVTIDGAYVTLRQHRVSDELQTHEMKISPYTIELTGNSATKGYPEDEMTLRIESYAGWEMLLEFYGGVQDMALASTYKRNYLTGLTAPVDDTDAVNKAYVDKHFSPIKHIYDAEETIYTLSADDMAQKLMFHIASGASSTCTVVIPADPDLTIPIGAEVEIHKWNSGLDLRVQTPDGTTDTINIRTRDTNATAYVDMVDKYPVIALTRLSETKWYAAGGNP